MKGVIVMNRAWSAGPCRDAGWHGASAGTERRLAAVRRLAAASPVSLALTRLTGCVGVRPTAGATGKSGAHEADGSRRRPAHRRSRPPAGPGHRRSRPPQIRRPIGANIGDRTSASGHRRAHPHPAGTRPELCKQRKHQHEADERSTMDAVSEDACHGESHTADNTVTAGSFAISGARGCLVD